MPTTQPEGVINAGLSEYVLYRFTTACLECGCLEIIRMRDPGPLASDLIVHAANIVAHMAGTDDRGEHCSYREIARAFGRHPDEFQFCIELHRLHGERARSNGRSGPVEPERREQA